MNNTNVTLCPTDELMECYKSAMAQGKTKKEMTSDEVWVDFHCNECSDCKAKIS